MSDAPRRKLEDRTFLALLLIVTIGFLLVVLPFFGALLWAVVAAIVFDPMQQRLTRKFNGRAGLAAGATLLAILGIVIIPAGIVSFLLLEQASDVYAQIQSGQIDIPALFSRFQHLLPDWLAAQLDRSGFGDLASARAKIAAGITASAQTLAGRALNVGQSAFGFLVALGVMLYVTYFLLRDGRRLTADLEDAVPLRPDARRALFDKFATVVQATIKGSVVVAVLQGAIGGIAFWALGIQASLLWGVAMGLLSLLPAIGTGLVWVPVAIYLFASGAIAKGVILVFIGLFVIGLVDNIVRPILVGRDTRLPDYIVLVSTLGGIELFGFSGFIIGPVIAALFMSVWEIFVATQNRVSPSPPR